MIYYFVIWCSSADSFFLNSQNMTTEAPFDSARVSLWLLNSNEGRRRKISVHQLKVTWNKGFMISLLLSSLAFGEIRFDLGVLRVFLRVSSQSKGLTL